MDDVTIAFIFVIFSCGPGWVFYNCLFFQLPYFQQHQPEGICLGTFMNLWGSFASVLTFCFYLLDGYIFNFNIDILTIFMLFITPISVIVCAFTYSIDIEGISWPLYIFSVIAAMIGNMSSQTVYPFLTRYKEQYNIVARSASDIFTVFICFLVLFQNPGSKDIRFSPFIFFLAIGVFFLIFPPSCFLYIYLTGIGLKDEKEDIEQAESLLLESELEFHDVGRRRSHKSSSSSSSTSIRSRAQSSESEEDTWFFQSNGVATKDNLWFYVAFICVQDFFTWGLFSSLAPFAFEKNSSDMEQASIYLSYAFILSSMMIVAGSLSTYVFNIPMMLSLVVFIFCAGLLCLSATSLSLSIFYGRCWALVALYAVGTYLTAHNNTQVFNSISSSIDKEFREEGVKAVGVATMIACLLGNIVAYIIASFIFKCPVLYTSSS